MAHTDWHPDEAALLQALDGELSAEAARVVEEHLPGCAACREAYGRVESMLCGVSAALREEQGSRLPAIVASRREFRERLEALEGESRRPAPVRVVRRYAWRAAAMAAAAAVGVVGFLLFYPEQKLRTVSARDVLERASAVRAGEKASASVPAVRQKLQIRIGTRVMTRTIYRDFRNRKQWDLWEDARRPAKTAPAPAEALRQRLADSPIDWDDPLSPERFTRWYVRYADKERDVVSGDGGVVSVQAAATSGPVLQASLWLRAADYHPIGGSVLFDDRQSVEISELEYQVLPDQKELAAAVAAPSSPPAAPFGKSDAGETEMQARSVLHELGADLGGEIQVRQTEDGKVEVSGFAGTTRQKQEMEAALSRLPGIVTKLETIDDLQAQGRASPKAGTSSRVTRQTAPLGEVLADHIPDSSEREALAGKALDLSQSLLGHAFALARLGDRYAPGEESRLSESGRETLRRMVADHAASIRKAAEELGSEVAAMFGDQRETGAKAVASNGWQERRKELLAAAQQVDADLTAVLSEGRESKSADQKKAALPGEIAKLGAIAGEMEKEMPRAGNK